MHQFIADFAGWNTAGSTDDAWGTVGAFERGEHATAPNPRKTAPLPRTLFALVPRFGQDLLNPQR